MQTYSLSQAADIIGVHRNTLKEWIASGCPVVEKADRSRGVEWKISIPAVMQWDRERAVEKALAGLQPRDGPPAREDSDDRKALANAIVAEIDADQALGLVLSRRDAEADVASFCQALRTGLGNAAARIAGRATTITSAPELEDMILAECNRAFEGARADLARRWPIEAEHDDDSRRPDRAA